MLHSIYSLEKLNTVSFKDFYPSTELWSALETLLYEAANILVSNTVFLGSLRRRVIGFLFMDMKVNASRQTSWVINGCNLLNAYIIFP